MQRYRNKKVLILGLGLNRGGLGAAKFFAERGANVLVTDLKTAAQLKPSINELKNYPHIKYTLGKHRNEDIGWADLVIRNPAIKDDNPFLQHAISLGKHIEFDIGIFLEFVGKHQLIGITGTKGKSTTASLIYSMLKNRYRDVVIAGNIGRSVLETIPLIGPDTLVVLELSSFQLRSFEEHRVSPKYSVITNIYPDHINYHGSMDSYIEAKRAIAKFQTKDDYLFINERKNETGQKNFQKGLRGKTTSFRVQDLPEHFTAKLAGSHNLENIAAALAVSKTLGIGTEESLKIAKDFTGIDYRLQIVKQSAQLKIINDSAATSPQATIEALKTFPQSILIAGGVNKSLPYKGLAEAIDKYAKYVIFLEGDATNEISRDLKNRSKILGVYNNLPDAVKRAKLASEGKGVILFSPGAASFNLFKNEYDRGEKFNKAVEKIFRRP